MVRTATRIIASRFASSGGLPQSQLQFSASFDHFLDDLIDRVAVFAGPSRDGATQLATNATQKGRCRGIAFVDRIGGKEFAQIIVVDAGVIDSIVFSFSLVVRP